MPVHTAKALLALKQSKVGRFLEQKVKNVYFDDNANVQLSEGFVLLSREICLELWKRKIMIPNKFVNCSERMGKIGEKKYIFKYLHLMTT